MEVPFGWDFIQQNITAAGDINPHVNFTVFISILLWNYQGWDMLGCMAGEVKNPKRTYPIGVTLTILFLTLTYVIPVSVGAAVFPSKSLASANVSTLLALLFFSSNRLQRVA